MSIESDKTPIAAQFHTIIFAYICKSYALGFYQKYIVTNALYEFAYRCFCVSLTNKMWALFCIRKLVFYEILILLIKASNLFKFFTKRFINQCCVYQYVCAYHMHVRKRACILIFFLCRWRTHFCVLIKLSVCASNFNVF